ncbi:MAG: hypothetical protein ACREL6_08485, partial [Gemmatimonadales bacterium]
LAAQGVMVAPHAVIIQHSTRSGAITLYNPNTGPAEVEISTLFGYPVTDSAGQYRLEVVAEPDSTMPSAAGWLQAFPRRTRLAPLQRQTVRILGRPPAGLPDGEYWARLVISARGGQVPIANAPDSGDIKVGLTLEVRTIIPVQYRKGRPTTGVALGAISTSREGDSLRVRIPMTRVGNAAYIGTLRAALIDSAGREVSSGSGPLAVYYSLAPDYMLPVAGLPSGPYMLHVELSTEREDLGSDQLLPVPVQRDSIQVRLP